MRKHIYILILSLIVFSGCSFLDINPKGEVIDDDMFTTDEGYQDALYGVYASLDNSELYGRRVSLVYPEAMAQNFYAKGSSPADYMAYGQFDIGIARTAYNGYWSQAYVVIGYINNIINNLEENDLKAIRHGDLYLGEALALRAMMHFDLARYFAVHINSTDEEAKKKAIPYVTKYSFEITPFFSIEEVYEKCINDLKRAEVLLEEDRELITYPRSNHGTTFFDCRFIHANLYAAQALLARIYRMKNDIDNTAEYARKVIDSVMFPLMSQNDFIQTENGVLNMKETIFGLYSTDYAKNCYDILGKTSTTDFLTLNSDFASLFTESQGPTPEGTDLRFSAWFGSTVNVSPACIKLINDIYLQYSDGAGDYSGNSVLGYSFIRIPEMYYIMAEALLDKDPQTAMAYFDQVIESRGMVKFAERAENKITGEDIYIERRKEFFGEGQQWFNMKRLKKDIVVTSSWILDGNNDATYKLLIPTAEDNRYTEDE